MWRNALIPTVFLALGAFSPEANSAGGAMAATASINFRVVIPAVVRVKALSHPDHLEIAEADVARGYVDLEAATSLLLTSNSLAGYSVAPRLEEGPVARAALRVGGGQFEMGSHAAGIHVDAPRSVDAPVRIGYRLFLRREAKPGSYRWPVSLSFMPRQI